MQARRGHRVIRKVEIWTVLRFSVLFYLAMLVVWLVAGVLLWLAASATGLIDNLEQFIDELFFVESFRFRGGLIFTSCLIGGLVLVLLGTGANVRMALIYNLISDVVGGVEVTVLDSEPVRRTVV